MTQPVTRRDVLQAGSAAMTVALWQLVTPEFLFAHQAADEALVPFLNMPRTPPNRLDWETLEEWITPQDQVFSVQHYGTPKVDAKKHTLEISGLVEKPMTLTMDQLQSLPKEDRLMTLECSGNGAGKGFINAIYNSKWTGTPLAALLKSCGIKKEAKEIVFLGADEKEESVRKVKIQVPFGRSLSIEDALREENLLAYQRNGKPLETRNGSPLRLIMPGWYGIANVKWLRRIEVRDRRYMGRFMGRDYVTIRGEKRGGKVVFVETSVAKMNLKSIIARVTRGATADGAVPTKAYGAVWGNGTEIKSVEVQVDGGRWQAAKIDEKPQSKYCWRFFSIDLGKLKPGKHTLVSRATDAGGRVQPSADDDEIALKKTFWEAYQQWPREIELKA
ncbi:MAG: sulfite oxidase [Planctomycetes bacterium]|nr:sulfite oxidase [Planctomycetota bacterium]